MRLDAEQCRVRAATARFAVLATVNRLGEVDLVPVTFALVPADEEPADRLVSAVDHKPKSTQRLARLANIAAHPAVTVLFDQRDDADWSALWWVRAKGTATVEPAGHRSELLVARYPQYRDTAPSGPVIEVTVHDWQGWSASRTS